ncbi:MAG: hypothetical protein KBH86_13625 [Syntrophorhabdus sp.]|nr:hypothetical protein [Syntrophorhabdus sp.]
MGENIKTGIERKTGKELKFLDFLFGDANFNATLAYKMAGFSASNSNIRTNAHKLLKKLSPLVKQWLDDVGLTDANLKIKLLQKLEAKETKFFTHEGKVITRVEVDALSIQLKALELAMKAKGMLSDKSTREIDQIDKLIELELEKLAATRNGSAAGV